MLINVKVMEANKVNSDRKAAQKAKHFKVKEKTFQRAEKLLEKRRIL